MSINKILFEAALISEKQFGFLESIRTEKVVSLYYELRLILYLGILLLTGGLGYLAYENIGEFGHFLLMLLMAVLAGGGYYFVLKKSKPYSNFIVKESSVYLDYIIVLVALLVVGLFTYIQVYFDLVEELLNYTSLLSAGLFFYMAYRFDNKILLSMAITALVATFGLTITPVGWLKSEWFEATDLYLISIIIGLFFIAVGYFLSQKSIKEHFLFSYQNYGLLLFYGGCITSLFVSPIWVAMVVAIIAGGALYYTWKFKQFLFFLYSVLTAYIALTYLIFMSLLENSDAWIFMIYYFPITCVSAIGFFISNKAHFKND